MKKHLRILIRISVVCSFISLIWLGYDYYLFNRVPQWFEDFAYYEPFLKLIDWSLVFTFLSHILIILTTLIILNNVIYLGIAGSIVLLYGFISFISIYGHFACLHDIVHEYQLGFANLEIKAGKIIQIFQMIFFLYSLVYFILINSHARSIDTVKSQLVEKLFISNNFYGIICGIAGIILVMVYSSIGRPIYKFELIPFGFVLLPYVVTLAGWQLRIVKDNSEGRDDKKQKSNMKKAAIISFVAATAIMILIYMLYFRKNTEPISLLWLPFYVFMVLLIFSGSALYTYKRS